MDSAMDDGAWCVPPGDAHAQHRSKAEVHLDLLTFPLEPEGPKPPHPGDSLRPKGLGRPEV